MVLNALHGVLAGQMQLVVRSALDYEVLASWLQVPFEHVQVEDDVGMRMADALHVDVQASEWAYEALHNDWLGRVGSLADWLSVQQVNLVLADVPYLPLAAARQVHIRAVAMCSLNWADIVSCYFPHRLDWQACIRHVYASADLFMVPEPGMPMAYLPNRCAVGPVGRTGAVKRSELLSRLDLPADAVLVLSGMGGVAHPLEPTDWPKRVMNRPVHYFVPPGNSRGEAHTTCVTDLGLSYIDVLCSMDVVMTKPGYGMFVEAAGAGVPVLYVGRDGWPDVPSLEQWIHRHAHAQKISQTAFSVGAFAAELAQLLAQGPYKRVALNGAQEAAHRLSGYLA